MRLSRVAPLRLRWLAGVLGVLLVVAAIPDDTPAAGACPNEALRTGPSAALPDCRAYELVSPELKAHDVLVNTKRFRTALAERPGLPMAVVFQSLGGFPGVGLAGSGIAIDYMAQRALRPGSSGWETHAITPPQDPLPMAAAGQGLDPLYVGEADPYLTKLVHRTWTPLTPAPNLRKLPKLYLRTDLRTPGAGTYHLVSNSSSPLAAPLLVTPDLMPRVAGVSVDLRKVVFETVLRLTPNAPAATDLPKLYKSVDGVVQFVGILPGGAIAPASFAGQSVGAVDGGTSYLAPGAVSEDGSRVFFTVPETPGDQSSYVGDLYMRDDRGTDDPADDVTVHLNESERTPPQATARPAKYWYAAADGSRVFFTTREALTDDAPTNDNVKLYAYDTTVAPDGRNLAFISADREPADGTLGNAEGVIEVSHDGRTAYFLQVGQIVADEPPLGADVGIYVWREGAGVRYLGRITDVKYLDEVLPDRSTSIPYFQRGARVTPDGNRLLISLRNPPNPGGPDHGDCSTPLQRADGIERGCALLYLYDYEADGLTCVSCSDEGPLPSADAFFAARENNGAAQVATHENRPLTDDGSRVFFVTGERLLPEDVNDKYDVYQYDVDTGERHLLSSGKSNSNSYFLDATPDGRDVFIATRERLSPWDVDDNVDVYDLRVGGGVAPPPSGVPPCEGDACQGPLAQPLPAPVMSSSTFDAPPDRGRVIKPKRPARRARKPTKKRCAKGKVRKRVRGRVRCVPRKQARKRVARRASGRKVNARAAIVIRGGQR